MIRRRLGRRAPCLKQRRNDFTSASAILRQEMRGFIGAPSWRRAAITAVSGKPLTRGAPIARAATASAWLRFLMLGRRRHKIAGIGACHRPEFRDQDDARNIIYYLAEEFSRGIVAGSLTMAAWRASARRSSGILLNWARGCSSPYQHHFSISSYFGCFRRDFIVDCR